MRNLTWRAERVSLILAGILAGGAFGLWTANHLQLRFGEQALLQYARCILRVGDASAIDARRVYAAISADRLTFCSDDELVLMRRLVYDNTFVKDIGRVRDGMLYCTSSLGRLAQPVRELAPHLSFETPDNAFHTDISSSPTLLFAPGASGIIAVAQGISVVFNPGIYAHLDNPPMQFTGLLYDHEHHLLMYGMGHPWTLPTAEVLAQKAVEHDGTIYQPVCSPLYAVCIVAFESRGDILARRPGYLAGFAGGGALLGMSVVSSLLLFHDRQRSFEQRLRRAVRQRQLTCAYQPIIDLESGAIIGAEALARWTNELGEPVPPDVFIPVAEARGFVGEITRLMIDRVLHEVGDLLAEPNFLVTINIAVNDLSDPEFFDYLARRMAQSGVRPSALAFELTERSRVDHPGGREAIARLRASGHLVFIDDFGTGYSSLGYLQDIHVDAIKIDQVFTQTIGTQAVNACVLPQILQLASRLGLTVIVEGVETSEQADYFRKAAEGVWGQGWFLGRPVPAGELQVIGGARRNPVAPE